MRVAIIGGGAGGFFSAIAVKSNHHDAEVVIFEKSKKVLTKVKVSGGGRCNVTNACADIKVLSQAYPRGGNFLKKAFGIFNTKHLMQWFESHNVPLVIQADNHVFPKSQDSQSIIDCFLNETKKKGIVIKTSCGIRSIKKVITGLELSFSEHTQVFDKVIIATGGSPKRTGLEWLEDLGHTIIDPIPSLFTFNMPKEAIISLMGIVVENALVSVRGTKLKSNGPLLITHWGMSGPAILKLSAFGARILSETSYNFSIQVNWVNEVNSEKVHSEIIRLVEEQGSKFMSNYRAYGLQDRLWQFLIQKCEFSKETRWSNIGKKGVNKLVNILTNDIYEVNGKTTFKEEFVTCGGVSLSDIDVKTMQSKVTPNLYFCGEVMDIDGITGGYNFQSAWTTGYIAGKLD